MEWCGRRDLYLRFNTFSFFLGVSVLAHLDVRSICAYKSFGGYAATLMQTGEALYICLLRLNLPLATLHGRPAGIRSMVWYLIFCTWHWFVLRVRCCWGIALI